MDLLHNDEKVQVAVNQALPMASEVQVMNVPGPAPRSGLSITAPPSKVNICTIRF
jgi:hypothetical protein